MQRGMAAEDRIPRARLWKHVGALPTAGVLSSVSPVAAQRRRAAASHDPTASFTSAAIHWMIESPGKRLFEHAVRNAADFL